MIYPIISLPNESFDILPVVPHTQVLIFSVGCFHTTESFGPPPILIHLFNSPIFKLFLEELLGEVIFLATSPLDLFHFRLI